MIEHGHGTTVVRDGGDNSAAGVFIAILAAALVGFLIWLFAFSGLVFNRGDNTTINNNNPPAQNQPANPPANNAPAPGSS